MSETAPALLEVRDLKVHFPVYGGILRRPVDAIRAVDGVSFRISRGMTMGLVGESGSGKSTIGRTLVKLNRVTEGEIFYEGEEIGALTHRQFFPFRKKIQMVFQDPYNSLNPRMRIGAAIREPLDIHFPKMTPEEKKKRVAALLDRVNLPASAAERFPHEFSGGQRQRIGIARALAVEPDLLICDEPVSALDVSVQAAIVNLLRDLQKELALTYLFIAHDLAVVEHISDEVLVMTEGKIVEQATAEEIYANPQHPYTKKLLAAVPGI